MRVSHGFSTTRYDNTFIFDLVSSRWIDVTPLLESAPKPNARCLHAAIPAKAMMGDSLFLFGGCGSGGFGPCPADGNKL